MDIDLPEVDYSGKKPILNMFCPEERIPREIFWAGFGFQVWCQMLTYIIKNKNATLFLVDEPDIYLHSDLQRQLLSILKSLGPDIVIATHSTELISEAEINDILIVNKANKSARKIKDIGQLRQIFNVLGSNLNPVLTQIAKTRRVLFVEGKDFLIFSKFAKILKQEKISNRSDFAVVPIEGFNPIRLKAFKEGIEKTIGYKVISGVIFDRDYRSDQEVTYETNELKKVNFFAHIHSCKEVENFLINCNAINKAIENRIKDRNLRTNSSLSFNENIRELIDSLSQEFKVTTQAQLQAYRIKYEKSINPKIDESTIIEKILRDFDLIWSNLDNRLKYIHGKDFLSRLNKYLQEKYSINISHSDIISSFNKNQVPDELKILFSKINDLRTEPLPKNKA